MVNHIFTYTACEEVSQSASTVGWDSNSICFIREAIVEYPVFYRVITVVIHVARSEVFYPSLSKEFKDAILNLYAGSKALSR